MSSPSLPPLSSLRAFEAVARHASFKAAAAELLVTPSAVSHQIRQLEAHLEMRLLLRTPRTVTLTEQGRVLYTATAAGFGEIKRAIARLREDACAAPLTLSATAAFLNLWLVPRLGLLQTALPNIDVRLHASDMPEDLRRGAIDVAIRYGSGPFPGTASTPLCADRFTPVCSPSLGLIRQDDLHRVALIHIDGRRRPAPAPDWESWCRSAGISGVDTDTGQHFPDSMLAVQAAIAGQGVVLVSRVLVESLLATELLTAPLTYDIAGDAYHFVCAPELAEDDTVTALRAWFIAEIAG